MRRRTLLATGLALALLAGAACSDDEEPPPSADRRSTTTSASTTTSSTTSTTAPVEDGYRKARPDPDLPRQDIDINLRYPASFTPEQVEVVQAWANYRHVFYASADPPDPANPALAKFQTAQVLEVNKTQLADLRSRGIAARIEGFGSLRETVTKVELEDDSARLTSCQVDGVAQVRVADDVVVNDDVVTKQSMITLSRNPRSGEWQVSPPPAENLGRWDGDSEERCAGTG